MRKLMIYLLSAAVAAGSWFFFQKYEVGGLEEFTLQPRSTSSENGSGLGESAAAAKDSLRIASFNIQVFGVSKSGKPLVMERLAAIVRKFDIVAIQEIRATDQSIIPNFVELINQSGRRYDYVIGPRLGRTVSKEQYAYIFDTELVEVDRRWLYTVADPDDLLHREPYVAWFRTVTVAPEQAFTFSLVNIHTDPDETDQELDALDDVFLAVRNDGRGEDDVILLGDLNVDHYHLGELGEIPEITCTVAGQTTNTRGTKAYDNIVFHAPSTSEYVGRSGVFDFMREFNLNQEEALEISDHLPVWAEFSIFEGGVPGRVASRGENEVR